jgi:hypothetical protein
VIQEIKVIDLKIPAIFFWEHVAVQEIIESVASENLSERVYIFPRCDAKSDKVSLKKYFTT